MFALVDANNFYVSCERVFNPLLEGKPVVVLSNNDGCIISRSNEAKALGIKMAEPIFQIKNTINKYQVKVFSSNYTLYGDMSNRMMKTLATFTPQLEVYSIDEAFLNLSGMQVDFEGYGQTLRQTLLKNLGLPVGVGIASTKTLAKVANKIAKKNKGVFVIDNERTRDWAIRNFAVEDIWGIGRQYAKLLLNNNIKTAYDLSVTDSQWIRKNMTVMGMRVKEELLGRACIPIETLIADKQNIATTRAFGKKLDELPVIAEAVASHAVRCAEKLRRQKSVARYVTIFIHTDPFTANERYVSKSMTVTLTTDANSNQQIVVAALTGLNRIFEPGLRYKKAGVIVGGLSSEQHIQQSLFADEPNEEYKKLSQLSDQLNSRFGRDALMLAVQGNSPDWHLRQEKLSQRYTTRWDELLNVKAR